LVEEIDAPIEAKPSLFRVIKLSITQVVCLAAKSFKRAGTPYGVLVGPGSPLLQAMQPRLQVDNSSSHSNHGCVRAVVGM
jgi:hypothetical protein